MDDDFVRAEALQLEEVIRLSATPGTPCAVCRLMIVSMEASWKAENCDHVICIGCFAKYTTEMVATEMPICPVASCKNLSRLKIHEVIDVDDDGSLTAIKEIHTNRGKKSEYGEIGQCSRGTMICSVCKLMIGSPEASWKPENCNHVICIGCFAKYTTEMVATEMSICPVVSCKNRFKSEIQEVIDVDDDDDVHDSSFIAIKEIDNGKGKKQCYDVLEEVAQSSRGAMIIDNFYCTICMEALPIIECFPIGGCTHAFCMSCVRQYITAKVEENVLSIGCPDPGCKDGALHPEACRNFIAPQLFQRWGAALCDMAIGALKFYCPFKDCSVMLVDDHVDGDEAITNVECPHCSRMFCAQCKVPCHDGIDCAQFQRLGKDERGREDLQLRKVAHESKWQRCPKCKIYVERVEGCVYIVCRCVHCFCYLCGSTMVKGNHHCSKCKRTW
ncbi:potential E3 ubiquitin-protein ligase ariadne-1 [Brachypodium distachyon]|uniref:potential E3 ubiquitin-protein ligase ariadne-1 n=1 Tax=Brachypodium distachyon TaxID=15368 RepID=UPI000234F5E6|nr:potential E3 ubiquitin-protein ligase ariadne-1 [Brachypodium distachyon]|eukprot:XP_024310537.1 potential E3 ubiquitin-protein ligase ariadne-1 [Brachypodium distachyon]